MMPSKENQSDTKQPSTRSLTGAEGNGRPPAQGEAAPLSQWERTLTSAWQRYMADLQQEMVLRAHQSARQPGLLLDFGCGQGRWTRLLMDRGWQAVCIDKDADILSRCQQANPTAHCIHSSDDLNRLPFGDGELDLVLCIGVYHALESDWFLPEVRRVLAPGGLLSGAFFNKFSGRGLYRHWMDRWRNGKKCYTHSYGPWRKRARREGFEFTAECGLTWFPLPYYSNSPVVPMFTALERTLGLRRLPTLSPWVNFLARKR